MSTDPAKTDPSSTPDPRTEALQRACDLFGVQGEYWDIWGRQHRPPAIVQSAILESMGVDTTTQESLEATMEGRLRAEKLSLLPPCVVSCDGEAWLPISIPNGPYREVSLQLTLEDGRIVNQTWKTSELRIVETLAEHLRVEAPLPSGTPLGYHHANVTLLAESGEITASCPVVHCPDRVYQSDPNLRLAGVAISLYGLRSERNWGVGDFTDLHHFTRWAAQDTGAAFIALNPLHALANRSPFNTSPYLPASTFYRNFLYLDIEATPEFSASTLAQRMRAGCEFEIQALRRSELVNYEGVSRLKRFFLQILYRQFLRGDAERRRTFDDFRQREGALLERFAVYSALGEHLHRHNPDLWIWPDWPQQYQDPASPEVAAFAKAHWLRVEFWQFVYWLVDEQAAQAQRYAINAGMTIGLYHDLALATDRCGSDLWAHRDFYTHGCRVGAPPDDFSPKGQDWSFPPPNAARHRADGYSLFAAAIRNNSRHGGALRIDHVMRFFRLYWIPAGRDATQGTYVRERWQDLLRVVALESHRNRVIVIGEDLGTVEDYVRQGLAAFGVLSYRLLYFERKEGGLFKKPNEYPMEAVVSSTTHDLPTIAGFWLCRDIHARREAGLLTDETSFRDQLRERLDAKHKLIEVLHDLRLLPDGYPRDAAISKELTGELHSAIIGFLASANARLFVLNQEDLTKETDQQNLPGSTWEYPNWRRKMKYSIEDLTTLPLIADFTRMLRGWLERTGRVGRAAV